MEHIRNPLYVERHLAGNARGLFCALEVARTYGSRLTVVGVPTDPPWQVESNPFAAGAAQRHEATVRRWKRGLEGLAARAQLRGVELETRLLEGDAAEAIVREVARHGHDLVLKVAESDGLLWPWQISPTDRRLLRHCPSPVWILDPAQGARVRMVMAAVDVSPGRSPELNERIVRAAAALSDRTGAELRVVHAWSVPGESILASPLRGVSPACFAGILGDTAVDRRRRLKSLLCRGAPGRRPSVSLRKGRAVPVLRREARLSGADVLVVGNSHRSGPGAVVPGNVAEKLVGRVDGSVLAVGPSLQSPQRTDRRNGAERRWSARSGISA